MAKDFSDMEDSNRSSNPDIHSLSAPHRRTVLRLSMGAASAVLFAPWLAGCASAQPVLPGAAARLQPGFKPVPIDSADRLVVPDGYIATVLAAWGEPVGVPGQMPAWKVDASNSAEDQELQWGMHNDGMHYFPFNEPTRFNIGQRATPSSRRGLLVSNHEYTDDGLLHPEGMNNWTAAKVRKSQAAHGVSVAEVIFDGSSWRVQRPSSYARRITAYTPMAVSGPAAGHPLLRTAADQA